MNEEWIEQKKKYIVEYGFEFKDVYHLINSLLYKRCPGCNKYYELTDDNFHNNKNNPSGLSIRCKNCISNRVRKSGKYDTTEKYRGYKRRAKRKDMIFELTKEECIDLFNQPCYYCGYISESLNGIDRVDVTKGYTKSNSVPCCTYCNQMKGGVERWFCNDISNGKTNFLQHITRIYNYQQKKK